MKSPSLIVGKTIHLSVPVSFTPARLTSHQRVLSVGAGIRSTENIGDTLDPLGNAEPMPRIMRSMMHGSIHCKPLF